MKEAYLKFLKRIRQFRKSIVYEKDEKRGKLYFSWLDLKTEKIQNEKNEDYFYKNIVKYTLRKNIIDKYIYDKANKTLKNVIDKNYILKNNNYVFNNFDISYGDTDMIIKNVLLKRGNVVWIDFGFNIGNEFGGMHPAIILKNFDKELFVIPISSKKPKEYIKIEQELRDKKITEKECEKRKNDITAVMQIDNIFRYKKMTRWIDITRIRKVSILRLNYLGTIGKISGEYLNEISKKIGREF